MRFPVLVNGKVRRMQLPCAVIWWRCKASASIVRRTPPYPMELSTAASGKFHATVEAMRAKTIGLVSGGALQRRLFPLPSAEQFPRCQEMSLLLQEKLATDRVACPHPHEFFLARATQDFRTTEHQDGFCQVTEIGLHHEAK